MEFNVYSRREILLDVLKLIAKKVQSEDPKVSVSFEEMSLNEGFGYKMLVKVPASMPDKYYEVKDALNNTLDWLLQGNIDICMIGGRDLCSIEFQVTSAF